ncbi:MAG: rod shape-determining protein [Clostridium sp.]|uniref:cell division protein FtsA n=1 Tax=Clostridium sp. TaxID=1506 RepID=UPI0025C1A53B|nr:cell division FtsA domain-containing protein [Clostridium sp.]MCF0147402.1 rod shape-determining protein [Clostridium sp.]
MKNVNLSKAKFALDVGTRSLIGTVGIVEDNKFKVICEKYLEHEERAMIDGQIHDIDLVAKAVKKIVDEIQSELGIELKDVSIAAAGRFLKTINSEGIINLNIDDEITNEDVKSLELISLKAAENEINKTTEGKLYCVGYSVKNYFLNGFVISNLVGHKGEEAKVETIATFLPRSVVDSLYSVMSKVGLRVNNLTLEPIAAIEAVVPQKLRLLNIALVDIGAGTSDIAISSKDSVSSYGMVPLAGDEVTEAIAQECLVDFNTAEYIKRNLLISDDITYTDVIGFENTIKSENILRSIKPIVRKIAEAIGGKIIELNANKSPSALFLVGGGAHTPGLINELSDIMNIPIQRIAIKDRKAIENCISDNDLGSAGVTVLGIALTSIKNGNNDFIDVTLNGSEVTLFNSHNHSVMDVIIHAGINPNMLMAKNGKNLRYTLNGVKRVAFGERGRSPKIKVNGSIESLDKIIKSGDNIEIIYAISGSDANPKIINEIKGYNSKSFNLDNKIINLEPIILVNENKESLDYFIKENDNVNIILPSTIGDLKRYIINKEVNIKKDSVTLSDNYIINENDNLITYEEVNNEEEILKDTSEIEVSFNDSKIKLHGKKDYIFVDIFNYVSFDLREAKGTINLMLNGNKVGYTEKLKDGDNVEVFWT